MSIIGKAAAILLVCPALVLATPGVGKPERGMKVGDQLASHTLKTLDMQKVKVPAEEGLTVLLFWATWSPRSAPAINLWQEFAGEYAGHKVTVVSVNADGQHLEADERRKIDEFISEHDVKLPVSIDGDLEFFNEIGVIVLPTVIFVRSDGTLSYRYPSFPTSARLDLKEGLEKELGIWQEPTASQQAHRGKLTYQPKNNALLYYNLAKHLAEKGFVEKARPKYVEALQKDPDYADPLRALERIYFADGSSENAELKLKELLVTAGLEVVVEHIGEDVYSNPEERPAPAAGPDSGARAGTGAAVAASAQEAPAATPVKKALTPMERMKLLMEKQGK